MKADTQAVEAIARRVETLENKPNNNILYDDSAVINRLNVLEKMLVDILLNNSR